MTDIYPGIDDWDREALDLLPGIARAGQGSDLYLSLLSPLAGIEAEVEGVVRELADVEGAGPYVARMLALRYGIDAPGVSLTEQRRLAAAGAAAVGCDCTHLRALTVWRALTGDPSATATKLQSSSSYAVIFRGLLSWAPSAQYLRWGGRIMRDRTVSVGCEIEATVYTGGVLRLDEDPGLDLGLLAYTMPTWG